MLTRLAHIHPYPAMIADTLAIDLAGRYVNEKANVLDPFCGTGRTLIAASARGASCIGIDVNPLACMITRAKTARIDTRTLQAINEELLYPSKRQKLALSAGFVPLLLERRNVDWFSRSVKRELAIIISWLNHLRLRREEKELLAVILSATIREVSYARNDQWKLHRMSAEARAEHSPCVKGVFSRRLAAAISELNRFPPPKGTVRVITGDARQLQSLLAANGAPSYYDVIITSPPYGDSRTTVQYGAMSGISLGVLRHLTRLEIDALPGGEIDRRCLGGSIPREYATTAIDRSHWLGGRNNEARRRVARFLSDLSVVCEQAAGGLRKGGVAVFVISRRRVGGWRLHLDKFITDAFSECGLKLERSDVRRIEHKRTPKVINRNGHGQLCARTHKGTVTMREEHVLVYKKI